MNTHSVTVDKKVFKSSLLPLCAVSFTLAAIFGMIAVVYLFHPDSIPAIIKDLIAGQIYDKNAQQTWLVVYIILTILTCLSSIILSVGLITVLLKRYFLGMNVISSGIKFAIYALNISGVILLILFIYKSIKYIIQCLQDINEGIFPLFAFVLMEGFMFTLICLLFFNLRKFLECCMEASTSINYMLYSGKINTPSIPPFSVHGFLILGLVNAYFVFDRFFTFSYTQIRNQVIYLLPMTKEPIHIYSGLSFGFACIGCISLYFYLRGYKKKSEQLLFRPMNEIFE